VNDEVDIPLAKPIFDKEMEVAALNALRNETFVMGEQVHKFEEEFANYCGVKCAVSTSSGTTALHLTLKALGIDEKHNKVITTPLSFIATSNAVIHAGATPVFSDVDPETCCIDAAQIKKKITSSVKAILPVHLYGYPAYMTQILEVAKKYDVPVIEDACQAHGAQFNGMKTGSIGELGCFSFYSSKNMTVCGDGGMVVTNNKQLADLISKLRDCGRKSKYEHDIIGYTVRLNTVSAAIGRIQLKRIDEWNQKRRENARLYTQLLSDINDLKLPLQGNKKVKPVFHLYVIRTQKRNQLQSWLQTNGIHCGIHYPIPIHLQPIYKQLYSHKEGMYPQSELICKTCLSLPLYPDLTSDEIHYISQKIHEFFKN
jgi:perosamine synthetase